MQRLPLRRRSLLLAASALTLPALGVAAPAPRFELRSAFLLNLHHFLLHAARRDPALAKLAWTEEPTAAERQALAAAVAHHRDAYADRHPLDDEMLAAQKTALACAADGWRSAAGFGLPRPLVDALDGAAPAYARCLWPGHDAGNRRWIAVASALDEAHGAAIAERLQRRLGPHPLRAPLRVDVVWLTGTFEGAYTSDAPPHAVMPSARPDYQGLASLEMLHHEAGHTGAVDGVIALIEAELARKARTGADMLWHAIQFHTVGETTREVLAAAGIGYRPYAEQGGLFERAPGWNLYVPLLRTHWQAWVDGRIGQAEAIARMVAALPAA